MLSITDTRPDWTCSGPTRRELLRVGSLALGGLTLPGLLAARAAGGKAVVQDRSVVLLFLQGGPSHIEFFDPKMTAPDGVRSITGEVKTALPGVTFGGTFPKLAALAKKLAVVRSYASGNGGHTYNAVASGGNGLKAAASAVYARLAGTTHPRTGVPRNVLVLPEAVDAKLKLGSNFETKALPTLTSPGSLGPAYGAFDPSGGGQLLENLKLRLPPERFADRRGLLKQLDTFRRQVDRTGALEGTTVFELRPAVPVKLAIRDHDGEPTVGRFTFRDQAGHVYPAQARRLAPDLFFQEQVYRNDGDAVLLPPGKYTMYYSRGPEYRLLRRAITVPPRGKASVSVKLERWVDPAAYGFYSGDHHIHAAGCAHYTSPTEGVAPGDMYLQVKGEGLNVGCLLTWGPCYDHQRQYFSPRPHKLSEAMTVLKYDVEVSGFGSQALGHVNLLNLRDQTYPGSAGTKVKGWPTWTTPLMRWAKEQGAVTGYAHSANGLGVNPERSTKRLFTELDRGGKGHITKEDVSAGKLPLTETFGAIDADGDGKITEAELRRSTDRVWTRLPNLAIPEMNGIGAQEICVTSAMGVCDFISAMDTERVPEWNCWYHVMNCGFPLKVSGETDFPCITGSRVGQGRVYVQLGKVDMVDYAAWCNGIAKGRSYVSDGYAHALKFDVNGQAPGFGDVKLDAAGNVTAKATVAFAKELPLGTSNGARVPPGETRKVELIVNGKVAASKDVPADDKPHEVEFTVPIDRSSWVALRHFPQMHTNPVNVLVGGKPIRASRESAKWCVGVIEQLWRVRGQGIAAAEREEADKTFKQAIEMYKAIAAEAQEGS